MSETCPHGFHDRKRCRDCDPDECAQRERRFFGDWIGALRAENEARLSLPDGHVHLVPSTWPLQDATCIECGELVPARSRA